MKDDDLCSVFYVEARAFPIKIFAEEGLNVIVPTADYAVGQTTYKWGQLILYQKVRMQR